MGSFLVNFRVRCDESSLVEAELKSAEMTSAWVTDSRELKMIVHI